MYLFTIVYGPNNNDIFYFSDFESARYTLILLTMRNLKKNNYDQYVLLYQYKDINGKYVKSDIEYFIEYEKIDLFCLNHNYSYDDILRKQELIYELIETC